MRVKRPRKRYYHAHGVRAIFEACKDVKLEKKGVHVDWTGLMARYKEDDDSATESDIDEERNFDDDDESDTNSMDGLGK